MFQTWKVRCQNQVEILSSLSAAGALLSMLSSSLPDKMSWVLNIITNGRLYSQAEIEHSSLKVGSTQI
jgi:hypothetical protein